MIKNNFLLNSFKKIIPLDYNYFFSVGFWASLMIIIDSILGLTFTILLINLLEPVLLGKWYWILSVVSLLSLFLFSGTKVVLARDMINNQYRSFFVSLKFRFYGSIIASLILLVFSLYLYLSNQDYLILLSLVFYFPLSIYSIFMRYLYIKNDFKQMFYFNLIKMLFYYGFSILFLFLNLDFLIIIISYFYFQVLIDLLGYLYYKPSILLDAKNSKSENKSFYKLSLQMSLIYIFPLILVNLDKIILPLFFSLEELGIFGVILFIPLAVKGIFYRLYTPIFFKKFNLLKNNKKIILKSSFYLFILVLLSNLFLIFLLPFFYNYFILDIYSKYLYYIQLVLLFSVFDIIADYFRTYFESTIELKNLLYTQLFSTFFYFSIFLFSINILGFIGIIYSRIFYMIFNYFISLYFILKLIK